MMSLCKTYRLADVELQCHDRNARELLDIWRRTKGTARSDLIPFSSKLLILSPPTPANPKSRPLFSGFDAYSTYLLGDDWVNQWTASKNEFAADYGEVVSEGQATCYKTRSPVYDVISSTFRGSELVYERLLLPLTISSGAVFLACYAMPLRDFGSADFGSSEKCPSRRPRQRKLHSSPYLQEGTQIQTGSRTSL